MAEQNSTAESDIISENFIDFTVHSVRIIIKLGIIMALYLDQNTYLLPLTIYVVLTEIIDQTSLFIFRKYESLRLLIRLIYSVNSVMLITVVAYFARWALTDFYLIYLIHISSAMFTYGIPSGLISFVLSLISYSYLLYIFQAPFINFIRLPLLAILAFRMFMGHFKYEKIDRRLTNVLNLEKTKKDFIAIASHNLRTPVASIYGYLEYLLENNAGKLNEEQALYVNRIKNVNQELEKISEQLLQISILEVGKAISLMRQPSQIEREIEDVVENYTPIARKKGLNLSFIKGDESMPLINIDVEKIRIVLMNVVDNAIKYTEKGSISISVTRSEDTVVIAVKDTGVGIPPAEIPKIFTQFYRAGNILIYNKPGTGLGLYLSKKIIDSHGGSMHLNSTEGQGSTFYITLPVIKEDVLL